MYEMNVQGTDTRQLEELALRCRRDYVNQWRKRNPEKVKGYIKAYWEKRARAILESSGNTVDIGS